MIELLIAFISSLVIVIIAIPSVIRVSYLKHLYDVPDERKSHEKIVPTLGGLAIFAGFMISSSLTISAENFNYNCLVGALMIVFFIGIKDDILITAPIKKLIGQLLAAGILVVLGGVRISSMHGFMGIEELAPEVSTSLTIFTLVVIMNGFNLIDGINWLSSGVSVVVSSFFGYWFWQSGYTDLSVLSASLIGSLIGFMWFNKTPAKIFMGDTGSLALGATIGSIAIMVKHEIVLAIAGGLFVLETFSVIIQVISYKLTGKRVFMMAPLHHHFEKKGWAESTIVIRFWIITIVLALLSLATLKIR